MSRYEVLTQLARGGMGEILLARKLGAAGFERLVVLKRPLHGARVAGLIDEARLLAQIHHPNVCGIYDLEEASGELFFVMELLDGISLWKFLDEPGRAVPLPAAIAGALFEQVCDGLGAIHALGMVHRDISPSNLFATAAGIVKILDLGIARPAAADEGDGRVQGKLAYCAPEQLRGHVDPRSDLFALGLVMHDVALGRKPPRQRVGAEASLELAALPLPLAEVIGRAAARDPGDRYASAAELAVALRRAAGGLVSRAELASWLAARFAAQIAEQRAVVDRAVALPSEDAPTRVLELQPATERDVSSAPVPDRLPRATEQLVDQLADEPPRPRRRARRIAGVAAVTLVGLGAALLLVGGADDRDRALPPREVAPPVAVQVPPAMPAPPAVQAPPVPVQASAAPQAPASAVATHPHKRSVRAAARPTAPPASVGSIRIDSQPSYATVDIDGQRIGTTPIKSWQLAAGHHRIHARRVDGKQQDVDVVIAADTQTNLPLSW